MTHAETIEWMFRERAMEDPNWWDDLMKPFIVLHQAATHAEPTVPWGRMAKMWRSLQKQERDPDRAIKDFFAEIYRRDIRDIEALTNACSFAEFERWLQPVPEEHQAYRRRRDLVGAGVRDGRAAAAGDEE